MLSFHRRLLNEGHESASKPLNEYPFICAGMGRQWRRGKRETLCLCPSGPTWCWAAFESKCCTPPGPPPLTYPPLMTPLNYRLLPAGVYQTDFPCHVTVHYCISYFTETLWADMVTHMYGEVQNPNRCRHVSPAAVAISLYWNCYHMYSPTLPPPPQPPSFRCSIGVSSCIATCCSTYMQAGSNCWETES